MIDRELLRSAAALQGISLTERQLEQFDVYAEMLVERNKSINLTAITAPEEIVYKHFADSLSLLSAHAPAEGASLIDVGSGAGFPGLPLAIARPDLRVLLLDSLQKRVNFLADVAAALGLDNLSAVHERAEIAAHQPGLRGQFDYTVARAVAPLPVLCELCLPFVREGGFFLPQKGGSTADELEKAAAAIETLGGQIAGTRPVALPMAGQHTITIIKKIRQTPPEYPRKPAKITKMPL